MGNCEAMCLYLEKKQKYTCIVLKLHHFQSWSYGSCGQIRNGGHLCHAIRRRNVSEDWGTPRWVLVFISLSLFSLSLYLYLFSHLYNEFVLGKKLTEYPCVESDVMLLVERATQAMGSAKVELREMDQKRRKRWDLVVDSSTRICLVGVGTAWSFGVETALV